RSLRNVGQLAGQLLTSKTSALILADDRLVERWCKVRAVFLCVTSNNDAVRMRDQLAEELSGSGCRGDDALRFLSDSQTKLGLIPALRVSPGCQLIAPQFHVLLAA